MRSQDINDYLRELLGGRRKDFRTWHATTLMAVGFAVSRRRPPSRTGRNRAVTRVAREVAEYLGNTPAVARRSYIDPRVINLYDDGVAVSRALLALGDGAALGQTATHGKVEAAVLRPLKS